MTWAAIIGGGLLVAFLVKAFWSPPSRTDKWLDGPGTMGSANPSDIWSD